MELKDESDDLFAGNNPKNLQTSLSPGEWISCCNKLRRAGWSDGRTSLHFHILGGRNLMWPPG